MNKKLIWIIIAIVVIGGIVLLKNNDAPAPADDAFVSEESDMMAAAFNGNGSIKCTYTDVESGAVSTIYVKNGKVRVDAEVEGATASGIYGMDMMYSWGMMGGTQYGFKFAANAADAQANVPTKAELQALASDSGAVCAPSDISDSLFVPPSDIQFQDMTTATAN